MRNIVWWQTVLLNDPSHMGRLHPEQRTVHTNQSVFSRRYWVRYDDPNAAGPDTPSPQWQRHRAMEIVGNAFTRLRSVFPSLSRLIPFRKIEYTDEVDTMAVDPYGHLYISPRFVTEDIPTTVAMKHLERTGEPISEAELVRGVVDKVQMVLLHEALHLALTHFPRFDEYRRINANLMRELEDAGVSPHSVFNEVADLEINTIIEDMAKVLRDRRVVSPDATFDGGITELPLCDPHMPLESNYQRRARDIITDTQQQSPQQQGGGRQRQGGGQRQQSGGSRQQSGGQQQQGGGSRHQSGGQQQQGGGSRQQSGGQQQQGDHSYTLQDDLLDENNELVRRTVARRAREEGISEEEYERREVARVDRESHDASEEFAKQSSGQGSGHATRLIRSIRARLRVNWAQVLREFMAESMGFSARLRGNPIIGRRHPSQLASPDILLPRLRRQESMRVLVLIDCSGSIDNATLGKFLGHMEDLAEQMGVSEGIRFTFVPFTNSLLSEFAIEVDSSDLRERTSEIIQQLQHGGSTDVVGSLMNAVGEFIEPSLSTDTPYSGVLVLTDGITDWGGSWDKQFRERTRGMPLRFGITESTFGLQLEHPALPNLSFPLPMET